MNRENQLMDPKDSLLWEIAKRRASFRSHLLTYLVINGFLWAMWAFRGHDYSDIPWPIWPTLGWGIGLAMHYISAYVAPKENSVEKEFEKLKREQNK